MENKTIIVVSACLLGEKVRYDGSHKYDHNVVAALAQKCEIMRVCPETQCGMSVPRPPMHLERGDGTRLISTESGKDLTGRMESWIKIIMADLEKIQPKGFILKSKSPSCGLNVNIYEKGRAVGKGPGLFAGEAKKRFPGSLIADEHELADPEALGDFLQRVKG